MPDGHGLSWMEADLYWNGDPWLVITAMSGRKGQFPGPYKNTVRICKENRWDFFMLYGKISVSDQK